MSLKMLSFIVRDSSYMENLHVREGQSSAASALQLCYWGGRVGRYLRSQGYIPATSSELRDLSATPTRMEVDMPPPPPAQQPQAALGVPPTSPGEGRETFILDVNHAFGASQGPG
jgi:hypothetical protein